MTAVKFAGCVRVQELHDGHAAIYGPRPMSTVVKKSVPATERTFDQEWLCWLVDVDYLPSLLFDLRHAGWSPRVANRQPVILPGRHLTGPSWPVPTRNPHRARKGGGPTFTDQPDGSWPAARCARSHDHPAHGWQDLDDDGRKSGPVRWCKP